MARRSIRSTLPALAALAVLSSAPQPGAVAADAAPQAEAEAWRIVCTIDGREVLRREPVFRIWSAGEGIEDEPAAAPSPGSTVCRWESLAAPPSADDPPAATPAALWEAPDLSWLTPSAPPRAPAEALGPRRPHLIAARPEVRAVPAALQPVVVELAPAATQAEALAAWRRLALAHAGVLAGRMPEIVTFDIAGIGVFHRARLAVAGPQEAGRLCAALARTGDGCWLADAG